MTSFRYILLVTIYLAGHYFTKVNYDAEHPKLVNNPLFILSASTFLFFIIIKFQETNCSGEKNNKKGIPTSYIFSQAVLYTILAILSQYIYKFFLDQECIDTVAQTINDINDFSYIPEALFIAGFILLINNLSLSLIYPKCN